MAGYNWSSGVETITETAAKTATEAIAETAVEAVAETAAEAIRPASSPSSPSTYTGSKYV